MRVIIIGGGIGGLCLAQGLTRAGVESVVYERDVERAERLDRYRLHINPAGSDQRV
jgi:2-polyprenyl-6-methoxyphenol hydroxylase-like FAD-dependent oxidoreductase